MRTRVIPIRRFGTGFWRVAGWIPFRNGFNGTESRHKRKSTVSTLEFAFDVPLSCLAVKMRVH